MGQTQAKAFWDSLTTAEKAELNYRWQFWARSDQLMPVGDWQVWLILAGRGWGKTRCGAESVRSVIEQGLAGRVALVGRTAADVRDVMIEGESGILAVSPPWNRPKYEPSKRRLTWPNGAIATAYSGDEPDLLRGPQHDFAWADELAAWRYPETWDQLQFGLRLGANPRSVVTTTPRPTPVVKSLVKSPTTALTRGKTRDNAKNLAPSFLDKIVAKFEGTRLGRQELDGDILDDNPGALWQRANIDMLRVGAAPIDLVTIAVGVDPAVADPKKSADEDTAETGIIIAGITSGSNPQGYVLDDKSLRDSPNNWGGAVIDAYKMHRADKIIAEVNNGGALVEYVLATVAKDKGVSISYKAGHASRGKEIRAAPVAALYEQGKVHHAGTFPVLEDQMCEWEPGMPSPDHLDALVWVMTYLFKLEEQPAPSKTVAMNPLELMGGFTRRGASGAAPAGSGFPGM